MIQNIRKTHGLVKVIFILAGILALEGETAWAKIKLQLQHPKSQPGSVQRIGFENDVLTLEGKKGEEAFFVIRSDNPVVIEEQSNASAELIPGWDGTLGYGCYGIRVKMAGDGRGEVKLRAVLPATEPVVTTAEDMERFKKAMAERPSRFPDDAREFAAWQQDYRERLWGWLMGGRPARVPLEVEVGKTVDFDAFTVREVRYRSGADRTNTLLLSLPRHGKKAPLLVALHGHETSWGKAEIKAFEQGHADDYCWYFASHGWAVLQPATMDHDLHREGWTLQGQWTWDAMTALDYAAALGEVDAEKIAVCGLSTGAHLAMNILALDERVKAGVVGCILSSWNHYQRRTLTRMPPGCDCGITAQLANRLEQCDWAALAAGKTVQFQHGLKDACFCPGASEKMIDFKWHTGVMPIEEYQILFGEVERAWKLAERPLDVITHIHLMEHRVDNRAALIWLNSAFGGQGK